MHKFSNRALNLINNTNYGTNLSDQESLGLFIVEDDNNLTVKHALSTSELNLILLESFCILLNNRKSNRIFTLSFKELENFLRDDNLTPAFDSDTHNLAETLFKNYKANLLASWLFTQYKNFSPYDFIGKNRLAIAVIDQINQNIPSESHLKLHFFEHEFIYLYKDTKVPLDFVEEALELFFGKLSGRRIKLVAVEV